MNTLEGMRVLTFIRSYIGMGDADDFLAYDPTNDRVVWKYMGNYLILFKIDRDWRDRAMEFIENYERRKYLMNLKLIGKSLDIAKEQFLW